MWRWSGYQPKLFADIERLRCGVNAEFQSARAKPTQRGGFSSLYWLLVSDSVCLRRHGFVRVPTNDQTTLVANGAPEGHCVRGGATLA